MEKTLSLDVEDVAAIVGDRFHEIRLAREHRKLLVAVDGVNRLHMDALEVKRVQGLGHYDSFGRDVQLRDFLEARARQDKRALGALRQRCNSRNVAVIAVMVRGKSGVEFSNQVLRGDRWRPGLFLCAEIQVDADKKVVLLDEPARVTHPADSDPLVVRLDLPQNGICWMVRLRQEGHRGRQHQEQT